MLPLTGRKNRKLSLIIATISCFILLVFSSIIIYENQTISFVLYQILPTLQFTLIIDRLSAFFIFITSLIALGVSIYSIDYVEHYKDNKKKNILVSLMILFIISMILVISSSNLFAFIFFWEIMALSSFILVLFEYKKKETRKAGIFYFVMTQLSTVFLLAAFAMIYNITGSFNISPITAQPSEITTIFILLFLGFGIKAGIIPFHKWLPYAHPASPSNISALMSGIMIKVAIYGMIRFFVFVLTPQLSWGLIIFTAGIISAILGVIYALKEHDIKRLLAYHSIENIGIILIGLGLYIIFTAYNLPKLAMMGILGALFHTLNHAIFKSLLFLTTGSVVNACKTKNIEKMGGLIKNMPYTAILFFIGAISISALPPFNGFISELLIFQTLFYASAIPNPLITIFLVMGLAIFALTSALAAACFVKAFSIIFLANPRSNEAKNAKEVHFKELFGSGILAISCIILGVFPKQIFSITGFPGFVPDMLFISTLLLSFYLFAFATMRTIASNKTRITKTWDCGILSQNPKMEYTASGFSEPIVSIFKSIFKTKKHNKKTYFDSQKTLFKEGTAEIQLLKFFEEYLYMPIAKQTNKLSTIILKIQKGDVDVQAGYALVAILLILIFMGWTA